MNGAKFKSSAAFKANFEKKAPPATPSQSQLFNSARFASAIEDAARTGIRALLRR